MQFSRVTTLLALSSLAAGARAQIKYPVGAPVLAQSDSHVDATIAVNPGGPTVSASNPKSQTDADSILLSTQVAVAYPVSYHEANRSVLCGPNAMQPNTAVAYCGQEDEFKVTGDTFGFVVDSYIDVPQGGWVFNTGTGVQLKSATSFEYQAADRSIVVPFQTTGLTKIYVDAFYSVANVGPTPITMLGNFKSTWTLWKDADLDGKLDPAVDQALDSGTMSTGIGDWIDPTERSIGVVDGSFLLQVAEDSWAYTKYSRPFCIGNLLAVVENDARAVLQVSISW